MYSSVAKWNPVAMDVGYGDLGFRLDDAKGLVSDMEGFGGWIGESDSMLFFCGEGGGLLGRVRSDLRVW